MEFIEPSLLLCEDLPTLLKELEKFKYSITKCKKIASFYLSKNFSGPDRAQWSSIASMLLVYIATELKDSFDSLNIEGTFLNYSVHDWISRLHKFNSITKKNKTIVRDCVYQLYLAKKISLVSLVIGDPILLGALAHRISVRELMRPNTSGKSVVYEVLSMHAGCIRHDFLTSLYGAYKDDFKHVITMHELSLIVYEDLRTCLKFLRQTNVEFPAVDFALAHLHPTVVELIPWYKVEPANKTGFNDLDKAVYECSGEYLQKVLEKPEKTQKRRQKRLFPQGAIPLQSYEKTRYFRSRAAGRTIKIALPFLELLNGLGFGFEKTPEQNETIPADNTTFRFVELPMEMIELILQYVDYRTTQSLVCVSSAFKAPIARANLFKFHFPRKYHVQATPNKSWESLRSIYWRDISTMARWNTGKCKSFNVNGSLKALDDNIMVTAETLNGRTFSYFWTSCKDAHRGEKREIMTSSDLIQAMCIIDSTAADPIMALLSYDKLLICYGETKTTHKMPPVPFFATSIFCCNYKLYTDTYICTLDDTRISFTQLLNEGAHFMDVNPVNDMYLSGHANVVLGKWPVTLWSANREVIAEIPNLDRPCSTMKFLDEFRIVSNSDRRIDYFDTRKFVATPVDSFVIPFDSVNLMDVQNQRMVAISGELNSLATVWNLNAGRLGGGFHLQKYPRSRPSMVNTRFFCQQNHITFRVYDFGA